MRCRGCGSTEGVRLFGTGYRCPACTPAALAGRPDVPPPAPIHGGIGTPDQGRYGTAADSPRFRADGVTPWPRETKGDA